MVFSSMVFLCIFLPVVFLLHLILPGIRAKNWMLLLASLVFYAYGEPVYVLLMIASAFVNYLSALLIEKKPSGKKAVMTINVIRLPGRVLQRHFWHGGSGAGHPASHRNFLFHLPGHVLRHRRLPGRD